MTVRIADSLHLRSGKVFYKPDCMLVRNIARNGSVRWLDEPKELHAGDRSQVYIECREELSRSPDLRIAVGSKILTKAYEMVGYEKQAAEKRLPICFIGVANAGNFVAEAACDASSVSKSLVYPKAEFRRTFKEARTNSSFRWIDSPSSPETHHEIFVDNAISTGASLKRFILRAREDGYKKTKRLCFIDRQMPKSIEVECVYEILDIVDALVQLGEWPASRFEILKKEISRAWCT